MTVTLSAAAPRTRVLSWRRLRRAASLLLVAVAVTAGWLAFAPTAVGGPTSFVVTDGTSMLPRFHADGLVITHAESSYHVGEVVAYHNADLHRVVMHRIVAMDGDRFVFKGDNNPTADLYHPTQSEIVGREWIYVPGGGKAFMLLRQPLAFAILMGLLGMYAAFAYVPSAGRRKRRHHRDVA